ncbi:N-6 DNA methylase [Corynebacterium freneyi]|uniref:N-6 DNA methylase n=1 Tax=Corynebacterium freneyi TaxID=134034 RepID=UPI00254C3150|nr:N-6 DNA methylase [Corynebacterium freneyi]MDK8768163.1 N-6 DNA methylase [Corynebacterium freneyi]
MINDYITGLPVKDGPEESGAVQPFLKYLVEDLGYPAECIQSHPQWHVKASPSEQRASVPVDIAVFRSNGREPEDLLMIVECKKPGELPESGADRQIFNYMNWSSADIGVWTNGEKRLFWKKDTTSGRFSYEQIPAIPRYGEKISEIGQYRRHQLVAPKNLQQVFKAIRAHLAGNARGTTRDEAIAVQMINLVFCKIFDERFTAPDAMVDFRVSVDDTDHEVHERITSLFEKVRNKYSEVFDISDSLTLDPSSVKYVVGELQRFSLSDAGRDAVGEAFEVFIGDTLKGEQGQFFTPRNVIRLMVQLIGPNSNHMVIDPACGAGGFLIESLRQKWRYVDFIGAQNGWPVAAIQEEKTASAMKTIHGIDKDDFLVKVAKAYMAIMGDGKGSIFSEDSLDRPEDWSRAAGVVHMGSYDVVLANPPFGKDIKVKGASKLKQYRLAHKWPKNASKPSQALLKESNPQVLFVERCLQLAKKNGYVGIILPETYFHAPSTAPVRKILLHENNVVAMIDLPHNTFRPFNNAKCIAVIVKKGQRQQRNIKMIVANEMGHDHLGRPVYRIDPETGRLTDEIWDDLTEAAHALEVGTSSPYVFEAAAEEVINNDIWVPRYYWHAYNEDVDLPEDYDAEWLTIEDLIDANALTVNHGHGSPKSDEKGRGEVTYARVKDVVNWEIYRDPTAAVTEEVAKSFTRKYPLQEGDVVYVSRGSYRIGDVGIVGPNDTDAVLTREILVFRVVPGNTLGLTPYYLLYLLSTGQVRLQTKGRVFLDTTLPTIASRYRSIRLPWATNVAERKRISEQVERAVTRRWEAMEDIRQLLKL